MRGAGFIAAALFCATLFGAASEAAEPAPDAKTEGKADAGAEDLRMIAVTKRDCGKAVPASGPGSAAEPIEVDLDELSYVEDYDCKWVRSRATLRWTNYWHYRASAYADLMALYFGGYPTYRLLVESFADLATRMSDLQHADVEFVALFADLCDFEVADDVWVYGGPCHYGRAGLLQNVAIAKIAALPLRRLKGEANREVIGSYRRAPKDWPHARAARAALLRWIDDARKGPDHYHARFEPPEDDEERAEAAARRADPTTWANFISGPDSPLHRLRGNERGWKVEFFSAYEPEAGGWDEEHSADACVCLVADCAESWPLTPADGDRMWGDYVCAEVRREADEGWIVDY